ncbi:MAG TPA: DMT family transporter [Nonomuraea sp.]|nr:DMT family transporter [Nonomuraea sp.]
MTSRRDELVGGGLAASGALAYGVTVVIGRRLATSGLGSAEALGARFTIAALLLLAVVIVTRRPMLPAPGERLRAVLLGGAGYAVESTFFFLALGQGTAAAISLLFYSYPAMVAVSEAAMARRWPSPRLAAAVALSAAGAAAVAASAGRVDVTGLGVVFAFTSAASFTAYLLAGERLMRRTDSLTTGAWVAAGAAASLATRALLTGGIHLRAAHLPELGLYGLATAVAFTCMFAALRRIGPSRTAVVMTLEALCAVVLGRIFLGEVIRPAALGGGVAILAGATVASLSRRARPLPSGAALPSE